MTASDVQERAVARRARALRDAVEVAGGQQALLQRGEDDGADLELVEGVEQALALGAPVEHRVARLVDEQRGAQLAQDAGGLAGLLGGVVGDADVQRLALLDRRVQRAHRLLQRSLRVGAVRVEDVDVVEAHPLQALVERGEHVLARAPLAVRAGPHQIAGLGGDDQLVAVRREVGLQGLAEGGLGGAGRRAVVVGQVEVGDAEVEGAAQDGALGLDGPVGAEVVPQAERERGELQAAASGAPVGHVRVAVGVCGVQRDSRGVGAVGPKSRQNRSSTLSRPAGSGPTEESDGIQRDTLLNHGTAPSPAFRRGRRGPALHPGRRTAAGLPVGSVRLRSERWSGSCRRRCSCGRPAG